MVKIQKSTLYFRRNKRTSFSILFILFFIYSIFLGANYHSEFLANTKSISYDTTSANLAEITVPIDIVFVGYEDDYIDLDMFEDDLKTIVTYPYADYEWDEDTQTYVDLLDIIITIDYNFYFSLPSFETEFNSFVETHSWNSTTSALNITQLNLQEETGERMSIFDKLDGRAIDGEEVEQYLAVNKGYVPTRTSYAIYFLNQSQYDAEDHSFEHWFEIDETDPDSNETVDWFRLEWDNDLNPNVEYPYPCWGFQNRLFFIDPYSHQWYTKWTDIWWNYDAYEGDFDYLTVDLDTYLEGFIPGTVAFEDQLNTYLIDYLNDIVADVGARGDGLLHNEREISAQILLINDEATHGYSHEDLAWIFHDEIAQESFNYIVPEEGGSITLEETWIELADYPVLQQIIEDNTLTAVELGSYPWYRSDWLYLDGIGIFDAFYAVAADFFDLEKGDSVLTSWVLLLQNMSMVSWSYGEYREYTGLGGGGNTVCFKDLNRYFESDGATPRSGLSTLLIHELGHVLGFLHAEINNDATEGTGGFMRDVMSYYSEGTPYFSIFLKDSLYRTSSFVVYYRNKASIDAYRIDSTHNTTLLAEIDDLIASAENDVNDLNYLDAFLKYRQLYDLTSLFYPTNSASLHLLPTMLLFIPFVIFISYKNKKRIDH
ncbi:MAG: hypothetical protein FK734_17550 [Asgard group archaeon]|nr:hypothetical protein [Asgard group archaeon]